MKSSRSRFHAPVLILLAMITTLLFWSCIPQPIYVSTKRSDDGSATKSKNAGWFSTDSVRSGSANNQQAVAAGGVALTGMAGALTKDKQDAMMAEIKSWMGTPYKFGMMEKGKGTDCSGFVGYVFKKVLDIGLPRQSDDMYNAGESVTQKELKFGDLVFFQNTYKGSQGASHVGIWLGDNKFAHASTTIGVTISDLSEDYYSNHYLGCRKIIKH